MQRKVGQIIHSLCSYEPTEYTGSGDTGVSEWLLLSGPWLKGLVLFSVLLALEVHHFLGEANCFPRLIYGSFVASPSVKCLLQNLWKSLRSSTSSRASSHCPRLGSFCRKARTHCCPSALCYYTRYIDLQACQNQRTKNTRIVVLPQVVCTHIS